MKTYEDDLESMKENMWSNLYELADVATKVYEEEQRKKKGKSKIVYEEEDDDDDERFTFLDYVPKKIRSSLRYSQQRNYENLNGAYSTSSSSSSLRHLRCFETRSWLHYNTAETESPPYPNSQPSSCLTESTSRKTRVLVPQTRSSSGKFKKTKGVASLPRIARGTPEWLLEVMREMGVADEDPMLIFEKPLSASDVKSELSRLLLPFSMLTCRYDFLTPAEYAAIRREDIEEENIGVGTILVNKKSEMWGLRLKLWVMKKESGNGTSNYALNWGWNDVVKGNKLKADHEISLWSFRCRGVLCFALEHRVPLSKRFAALM